MCPIEDNFLNIWLNPAETYSYHNMMFSSWIDHQMNSPFGAHAGEILSSNISQQVQLSQTWPKWFQLSSCSPMVEWKLIIRSPSIIANKQRHTSSNITGNTHSWNTGILSKWTHKCNTQWHQGHGPRSDTSCSLKSQIYDWRIRKLNGL